MPEKKEEKKPLDMTSDEAMDYLFGQEAAQKLKDIAGGEHQAPPPSDDENGMKGNRKSARKHGTK